MSERRCNGFLILVAILLALGCVSDAQDARSLEQLLTEYHAADMLQQLELAQKIAALGDRRALTELEPYLVADDRHVRGHAALVFASLGEARGFDTLAEILNDFSDRGPGQGIPGFVGFATVDGRFDQKVLTPEQIRADRYYAVHLLGLLGDPRAVDVLVPLLSDEAVNYKVCWALGKVGDKRAISALIGALQDPDALVRTTAIGALEALRATEALPALRELLEDSALPNAGDRVPVGVTARAAIEELEAVR